MHFPVLQFDDLYHIGTMKPSDKGRFHNKTSLEGNGLSVSEDPDAWRAIAKLGGFPTWCLTRDGSLFVDAHALQDSHWQEVTGWATTAGLIVPNTLLEVSWFDTEDDCRRAMVFDANDPKQVASAHAEIEGLEENDGLLTEIQGWSPTPKLSQRIGFSVPISSTPDLALTIYAEDILHKKQGIHGVWWDDVLDVAGYSAPRGVIHLKALPSWTVGKLQGIVNGKPIDV